MLLKKSKHDSEPRKGKKKGYSSIAEDEIQTL